MNNRVFFGRIFVAEMLYKVQYVTTGTSNLKNFSNENMIHEGDYVFVKYVGKPCTWNAEKQENEGDPTYDEYVLGGKIDNDNKYNMNQLWQVTDVKRSGDKCEISFDKIITFDYIALDNFIRLDFFNLDRNLLNKTQKPTGNSFVELSMVDMQSFENFVNECKKNLGNNKYSDKFTKYVTDDEHKRRILFNKDKTATQIDVKIDRDNYTILPNDAFLEEVRNNVNAEAREDFVTKFGSLSNQQKSTPKAKFFRFWTGENLNPTLVGLWDFHCGNPTNVSSKIPGAHMSTGGYSSATNVYENNDEDADENYSADGKYRYDDPTDKGGDNVIIYGTPGCGKSHYLKNEILKNGFGYEDVIRVTFHQDYTYTDFVGQIIPVVKDDDKVTYRFVPGPFTLALEKAIISKDSRIALVIEEINRGNAASIFGDLFQLLDRSGGVSEYELTNIQIMDYLSDTKENKEDRSRHRYATDYTYDYPFIKIPSNLYIYATMNTGDQNVFTLDTAFKRRWKFKKISNIFTSRDSIGEKIVPGLDGVTWRKFVEVINDRIIKEGTFDSEDKQIGKYFVSEKMLLDINEPHDTAKKELFAYKVLEYLWNDVSKFERDKWFNVADYPTLDSVIEEWKNDSKNNGGKVFNSSIIF